ncbi:MAG TPA: 30S ribosomal protein S20 [Bdellovibrionota bacterium]|jgi:small subunit ribosomal protein S20
MANVKSAEKRNRQNIKRRARMSARRATVKTVAQSAMEMIRKDAKSATEALREATSVLAKAAARGVIPKARMARKISRMHKARNRALGGANA